MKKNKKKIITSIIIGVVFLLIIGIVIFNVFLARKDLNSLVVKEKLYMYFGTEKFKVNGKVTFNYDGNVSDLLINNKKTELYSEPIYYSDKMKLILPVNYNFVSYMTGVQNKVNYFTILEQKYDDYYLTNNNLKYKANNGFLYDGSDYYLFLHDAKVEFNGVSADITPFSYVNYIYDSKELYIYNYKEDKVYYYDNVLGNVYVTNDKFKVDVSSDIIVINNKEKLLMKNFEYLKNLK